MSIDTYFVDEQGICLKHVPDITSVDTDKNFFATHPKGKVYLKVNGGWRYFEEGSTTMFTIAEDLPKPFKMQLLTGSV